MNKKKLPKVILCRNGEAEQAISVTGSTTARQQTCGEDKTSSNAEALGLASQPARNVIQMIRPAASLSPGCESKTTTSPQTGTSARRRSGAHAIVDRHAAYSAIGGLAPFAAANFAAITAIIMRMVKVLCKHYGVPFKHDRARALVIALVGGAMPTGAAAITASTLLYIVPPTAVLGVAVSSVTAAVFTRSIGRVFIEHFETGASLDGLSG